MPLINSIATWWMRKRMHQIELFMKYPHDVQNDCFKMLLNNAKNTEWGKLYNYSAIYNYEQYKTKVPIQDYETLKPFIERVRKGEQNILWNSKIYWFAKSSGTTNDKSKFIPITEESLNDCHFNGGRDMIAIYSTLYPNSQLFSGKYLGLAGSLSINDDIGYVTKSGDLSAVVVTNLPKWMDFFSTPDREIALIDNWDFKLKRIIEITSKQNVVSIAGVPSWLLILLKEIIKIESIKYIDDLWPNLEVYFHGGVNFTPYKQQFNSLFKTKKLNYLELYNASEGFFGIQDVRDTNEMLLMLDYGIFYEFIEINNFYNKNYNLAVSLMDVKLGVVYAMIISTSGGLWRYLIGDTIMFTSISPYRIKIIGRTKSFINTFGEELSVDNADKALQIACDKTQSIISEYTVAPVYIDKNTSGKHQWLIEFKSAPQSIDYFTDILDNALKALNSDYEAKRYNNLVLKSPQIIVLKEGTFFKWLSDKNKLGGQHKIPRLNNDRIFADQLLQLINNETQ